MSNCPSISGQLVTVPAVPADDSCHFSWGSLNRRSSASDSACLGSAIVASESRHLDNSDAGSDDTCLPRYLIAESALSFACPASASFAASGSLIRNCWTRDQTSSPQSICKLGPEAENCASTPSTPCTLVAVDCSPRLTEIDTSSDASGDIDDSDSFDDQDSDFSLGDLGSSDSSVSGRGRAKRRRRAPVARKLKQRRLSTGRWQRPRWSCWKRPDSEHCDTKKQLKHQGTLVNFAESSSDDDLDGEEEVDCDDGVLSDVSSASSQSEDRGDDADAYPKAWRAPENAPELGHPDFNVYAEAEIQASVPGVREQLGACPPLQMHQEAIAVLLHPRSPVTRLLVDQPTGAGKTREMIAVLDQFFYDKRPKVPVFPRAAVCRNFYEEVLRWPSLYRDFFCCMSPQCAGLACGVGEDGDWRSRRHDFWNLAGLGEAVLRALCFELREVLEMKSAVARGHFRRGFRKAFRTAHPNEPLLRAPLRALSYASAGGSHTKFGRDGQPLSALLKFGYLGDGCVYSQKVILLDEAHNLTLTQTRYTKQLSNLRRQLHSAQKSVVVGFTGTPVIDDAASGQQLLSVIKGQTHANRGDSGFVASMTLKRPPLFPRVYPRGVPDAVLSNTLQSQLCSQVVLQAEALKGYILKSKEHLPMRKLQAYCNIGSHCCAFHGRRKAAILRKPAAWMPKLAAIATAVCRRREKAAILISRQGGYRAMLALMRRRAARADCPFGVACGEELAEFNSVSNARGEVFMVIVADSAQFSEGTSFRTVRRLYLADVPASAALFQQQCGRAARMFGHQDVAEEERSMIVTMPVAVLPPWMRNPLAAWTLRALCRKEMSGSELVQETCRFLQSLHAANITSLEDLKREVDEAASQACGVWDEASLRKPRLSLDVVHALLGSLGVLQRDDQDSQGRKATCQPSRSLVNALQALHKAKTAEKVVASICLRTADELMLESLASQLATQIPAVTNLRQAAISCETGHPGSRHEDMDLDVWSGEFQLEWGLGKQRLTMDSEDSASECEAADGSAIKGTAAKTMLESDKSTAACAAAAIGGLKRFLSSLPLPSPAHRRSSSSTGLGSKTAGKSGGALKVIQSGRLEGGAMADTSNAGTNCKRGASEMSTAVDVSDGGNDDEDWDEALMDALRTSSRNLETDCEADVDARLAAHGQRKRLRRSHALTRARAGSTIVSGTLSAQREDASTRHVAAAPLQKSDLSVVPASSTLSEAEEQARIPAELEARRNAEEDARRQPELHAQQTAEEEKIRREAKSEAEEQARIRAELEARRNAEEEARIQSELQAERKAEEEKIRIEAELETKRQAEEIHQAQLAAKRRAEAEAEVARLKEEEEHRLQETSPMQGIVGILSQIAESTERELANIIAEDREDVSELKVSMAPLGDTAGAHGTSAGVASASSTRWKFDTIKTVESVTAGFTRSNVEPPAAVLPALSPSMQTDSRLDILHNAVTASTASSSLLARYAAADPSASAPPRRLTAPTRVYSRRMVSRRAGSQQSEHGLQTSTL